MPALQVRDMPDDVYESLKLWAARDRRSVAQEAVVAIESYVASRAQGQEGCLVLPMAEPSMNESAAARSRRQAAFDRIHARGSLELPEGYADASALVREVREERDDCLMRNVEGVR